jgi:hypothetical protein
MPCAPLINRLLHSHKTTTNQPNHEFQPMFCVSHVAELKPTLTKNTPIHVAKPDGRNNDVVIVGVTRCIVVVLALVEDLCCSIRSFSKQKFAVKTCSVPQNVMFQYAGPPVCVTLFSSTNTPFISQLNSRP